MAVLISPGDPSSQRTGSVSVTAARRLAERHEGRLLPASRFDSPDKLIPALFAICLMCGLSFMVSYFFIMKNKSQIIFHNENIIYG